jgi:multisubunit Na+/H+ antiporter MnhG subunit
MYTLARAVRAATTIAVALIVAGIVIHLLGANTSNGIVSAINDAAKWLVQPFHDVFKIKNAKTNVAVNWGLAALVYAIVGGVIATALARAAVAGRSRRPWRREPVV